MHPAILVEGNVIVGGFWLIQAVSLFAQAREPQRAGVDLFESKIRPVLVQHCYECHSNRGKAPNGGLRLDSRAGVRKGGVSGPALVPGNAADSLLLSALRHDGLAMPPKGKLPQSVIEDFERWIAMGAPDPRSEAQPALSGGPAKLKDPQSGWAFQPLRRTSPPEVRNATWPARWLDRFVLARLEKAGLSPSADAEPAVLLRRLSIVLTGLPPTLELLDAVNAGQADAPALQRAAAAQAPLEWEAVVDRMLASPQFGERWGRHWLDLARYADSNGRDENLTYHHAWRYRNYVIDSFNADIPFDRFVVEQIAGDLLPYRTQADRDRQLIAAGFLVVGPKVLANRDKPLLAMDVVDEQLDTCGRVFLGMTVGCARCHDHKFDPISTADYYAMAGFFSSTRTIDGIKKNNVAVSGWIERGLGPDGDRRLAEHRAKAKAHKAAGDNAKKYKEQMKSAKPLERPGLEGKLARAQAEERALAAQLASAPPIAMSPRDEDRPADCRIHVRGETAALGPVVPRGFLSTVSPRRLASIPNGQSGRVQLAQWVLDPANPLTARVIVNRIWQHMLGDGLVRTCDNFGVQGERPTHPELLDEMAARFMACGWSIKRLVREIALSRTFRQAASFDSRAAAIDPENRLLWRANRRRVEAEVLRDAMLAASGELDLSKGGCPVAELGEVAVENDSKTGIMATDGIKLRSVYLPVIRNELPAGLELFDFADHDVATGRRDTTTAATQALYLLHSPLVLSQANATAKRLLAMNGDDRRRIAELYRRALSRKPSAEESARAMRLIGQLTSTGPSKDLAGQRSKAWAALCQSILASTEFRFVD